MAHLLAVFLNRCIAYIVWGSIAIYPWFGKSVGRLKILLEDKKSNPCFWAVVRIYYPTARLRVF
jgi:hypothetical protein